MSEFSSTERRADGAKKANRQTDSAKKIIPGNSTHMHTHLLFRDLGESSQVGVRERSNQNRGQNQTALKKKTSSQNPKAKRSAATVRRKLEMNGAKKTQVCLGGKSYFWSGVSAMWGTLCNHQRSRGMDDAVGTA